LIPDILGILYCSPQGQTYDPIFYATVRPENATPQTIFSARGLALVAVPWLWAMALKLVRYEKQDPVDCAAVLRLGFAQRGIRWTYETVEMWITERCWPMRFADYLPSPRQQLRVRIQDALNHAFPLESSGPGGADGVAVDEQRDTAPFPLPGPALTHRLCSNYFSFNGIFSLFGLAFSLSPASALATKCDAVMLCCAYISVSHFIHPRT
jgi:hypothetical protein